MKKENHVKILLEVSLVDVNISLSNQLFLLIIT